MSLAEIFYQKSTLGSEVNIGVEARSFSPSRVRHEWGRCFLMEIEVQKLDKDAVIKLSGRLDMNTSPDLRKAAVALLSRRKCKNLTINFAEICFIDTSGLATLLEILVETKEQCIELTLCGINEKVQYLIDVNGLTEFFTIRTSAEERLYA
jgi:anti-sigma B factor antagonist